MILGKVFYLRAYGAMLIALLMAAAVAVLTLPHEDHALKHHCEMTQLYADTNGEYGWPDYNNTARLCAQEK